MMKRVLITGASGLLGSELVKTFKKKGYDVLAFFNQNSNLVDPDIRKIHCDISRQDEVLSLKEQIDSSTLIVHCAALTDVNLCERNKELCQRVNVTGTKNISALAEKNDATLIYISTASVFDGKVGNYTETDIPNPLNFYSQSKLEGEKHVLEYENGIVVRTTPVGIHQKHRSAESLLEWLVKSYRNNEDISLFTDVRINPLCINTLSFILLSLQDKFSSGVIHIGSRNPVSKAKIGQTVLKFFPQYSGKVTLAQSDGGFKDTAQRPKEMWLNVDKALSLGIDLPLALSDIEKYFSKIAF